jgi:C4-dicarboxylate-specific signal transduction histidine kinase
MSYKGDALGEGGLQFFGKMTASISHEIKNALAIINESAGLLDDLTLLAEKGVPLDPAKLKSQAAKIMKQIQRADGIVKLMNRFAHSVDETAKSVDLHDVIEFALALSARFASMRGVTLETRRPDKPVMVYTNPFFLENVLWLCLDFAMDKAGKGATVVLTVDEKESKARVRWAGLGSAKGLTGAPLSGEQEKALMEALGAEIGVHEGEMVLSLPLATVPSQG